jgi:hypothetical protein
VRFHHRSVLEYLAAKRLSALLKRVPIKAVKRIVFAETAQGEKVVRPSMRPVAAWLSSMHDGIFDEVLKREPEVLLDHGDPQPLSPALRAMILKAYASRYGKGKMAGPFDAACASPPLRLTRAWPDGQRPVVCRSGKPGTACLHLRTHRSRTDDGLRDNEQIAVRPELEICNQQRQTQHRKNCRYHELVESKKRVAGWWCRTC